MLDASNVTLVGTIRSGDVGGECVYKPVAGERPLWDFPDGTLAGREISAFLVSEATGWRVVPPTVLREGPFGPGMVQLWIDGDEDVDLAEFVRRDDPALRRMAVFDAVVNNADRKGGHIIPMPDGHVYGVDHGICFSVDPSCARCCGAGPAGRSRSPRSRCSSGWPTTCAATWGSSCTST